MTEVGGRLDNPGAEAARLTEQLESLARGPDGPAAIEELIDLGLRLVDWGVPSFAQNVVASLTRLTRAKLLSPAQRGWSLNMRALCEFDAGHFAAAERTLARALAVVPELDETGLGANTQLNLGIVAWSRGDLHRALGLFLSSRRLSIPADHEFQVKLSVDLAGVYLDLQQLSDARHEIDAIAEGPSSGIRSFRASLFGLRGLLAVQDGRLEDARLAFAASVEAARGAGELGHLLTATQNLASVDLDLGRIGPAIRNLRRAERMAVRMASYRHIDGIQRTLATALHRRGRGADARRVLERSRVSAAEREDANAWARSTADLGAFTALAGRSQDALPLYEDALEQFEREADAQWGVLTVKNECVALVELGRVYEASQRLSRSARRLRLSRVTRGELEIWFGMLLLQHDHAMESSRAFSAGIRVSRAARVLGLSDQVAEIAASFQEAQEHRHATRFFGRSIRLIDSGSEVPRYQMANDRAISLLALGRLREAMRDLLSGLAGAEAADDQAMRTILLSNLSEASRRSGALDVAVGYGRDAVDAARITESDRALAEALATLGLAELSRYGPAVGNETLRTCLKIARRNGAPIAEAIALLGLAESDRAARRWRRALVKSERAAKVAGSSDDVELETRAHIAIGMSAASAGDRARSQEAQQRITDLVQQSHSPLEVALDGLEAIGGAWLERGNVYVAAESYVIGFVLAATEGGDPTSGAYAKRLGRALVGPFSHAGPTNVSPEVIAAALQDALRESLGRNARPMLMLVDQIKAAWIAASATTSNIRKSSDHQ